MPATSRPSRTPYSTGLASATYGAKELPWPTLNSLSPLGSFTSRPPMVTRNREMFSSWRSVQPSWATSRSASGGASSTSAESLIRSTCATPLSLTVTDTSGRSPAGRNETSEVVSSEAGPWSSPLTSDEANCTPRGTKTGSGTRIVADGSKK